MNLTKKQQDIVNLATVGGSDKELLLLEKIHAIEDEMALLKNELNKDAPEDARVEKISMRLAAKLATLEKGEVGEQGIQGEQGQKGDTGTRGPKGEKGDKGQKGDIGPKGQDGFDGLDGVNGLDADETAILDSLENKLPELGFGIRDALELLQGDERLERSAIRGLDDLEKRITEAKARPGWGAHPLTIKSSSATIDKNTRVIKFTGATVTRAPDGTVTVAISGGGLSVLTATGAVDNSNKVFTFVSAPTIVVVNGASYITGGGVTIVGTTATLDSAVGTGGSIYGLG